MVYTSQRRCRVCTGLSGKNPAIRTSEGPEQPAYPGHPATATGERINALTVGIAYTRQFVHAKGPGRTAERRETDSGTRDFKQHKAEGQLHNAGQRAEGRKHPSHEYFLQC